MKINPLDKSGFTFAVSTLWAKITDKFSTLAKVASTGKYEDLIGKPVIPAGVTVDSALSSTSENPVQNKVINTALAKKANLASPTFTGAPKAPTPASTENSTRLATTAYVKAVVNALVNGAPETLDTLKEIADAIAEHKEVTDALNAAIGDKLSKSGTAAAANRWATARNINGMSIDGSANRNNYGTCTTASNVAEKNVSCTGFSLIIGAEITVKFTNGNIAANPTLNVNSTGAKPIYYHGSAIPDRDIGAKHTYTFRYNGEQWELVGNISGTDMVVTNILGGTDLNSIVKPGLYKTMTASDTRSLGNTFDSAGGETFFMIVGKHLGTFQLVMEYDSGYNRKGRILFRSGYGSAWSDWETIYTSLNPQPIEVNIPVDSALSSTSKNPVQNKVINTALAKKANLASPTFTGAPKAPTPASTENSTRIATTAYVKTVVNALVNGAPETLDTLKEIADAIAAHQDVTDALNAAIGNKVDKVSGKGLSTNDFTTAEKNKLAGLASGWEHETATLPPEGECVAIQGGDARTIKTLVVLLRHTYYKEYVLHNFTIPSPYDMCNFYDSGGSMDLYVNNGGENVSLIISGNTLKIENHTTYDISIHCEV